MYMSYCMHEGTYHELRRCIDDVEAHMNEEAEYSASESEIEFFTRIVEDMVQFLNDWELTEDEVVLNDDMMAHIAYMMKQKSEEEED